MKVDVYVKTAKDAAFFDDIFSAGTCNLSNFTKEYIKELPEMDRKINVTYHIEENKKK